MRKNIGRWLSGHGSSGRKLWSISRGWRAQCSVTRNFEWTYNRSKSHRNTAKQPPWTLLTCRCSVTRAGNFCTSRRRLEVCSHPPPRSTNTAPTAAASRCRCTIPSVAARARPHRDYHCCRCLPGEQVRLLFKAVGVEFVSPATSPPLYDPPLHHPATPPHSSPPHPHHRHHPAIPPSHWHRPSSTTTTDRRASRVPSGPHHV